LSGSTFFKPPALPEVTDCNYPGRLRVPLQSAFTAFLRKG
jgi:hypothetical protein